MANATALTLRADIARQHAVRAGEPLRKNVFQERSAVRLEQHVHVARRDPEVRGHAVGAQIGMMQVAAHESLCGHKPRRAHAAAARHGGRVARGAERQCRQVVEVRDHKLGQFRRRIRRQVVDSADVAFEQGDRLVVVRHCADERVLEIADQSREFAAREAERQHTRRRWEIKRADVGIRHRNGLPGIDFDFAAQLPRKSRRRRQLEREAVIAVADELTGAADTQRRDSDRGDAEVRQPAHRQVDIE